ncbi:hypothetical protein PQR21_06720 [Paraburkholderia nemoris]|uniref:hypothetical protein n=1 Tax=Paraburkholderia nemoris TaxID=2793076 RepID=UPI0038BCE917
MSEITAGHSHKLSGLFEVCFGSDVQLLGVIRGIKVATSEGTFSALAVRSGNEVCVVAGPVALGRASDDAPNNPLWVYLGHRDVGLHAKAVRRFGSLVAMGRWVLEVRSTAFHPAVAEMVML